MRRARGVIFILLAAAAAMALVGSGGTSTPAERLAQAEAAQKQAVSQAFEKQKAVRSLIEQADPKNPRATVEASKGIFHEERPTDGLTGTWVSRNAVLTLDWDRTGKLVMSRGGDNGLRNISRFSWQVYGRKMRLSYDQPRVYKNSGGAVIRRVYQRDRTVYYSLRGDKLTLGGVTYKRRR